MVELKIPINNEQELDAYRKAVMTVLSKIEISDCDRVFIENLKSVYKLLGHLNNDRWVTAPPPCCVWKGGCQKP